MLALMGAALVIFVLEIFPIEVTALGLLAILLLTGLVDLNTAVEGLSNKAVVTIGCLLVLSHSLTKTGILEVAVDRLSRRVRRRRWLGVGLLIGAASLLSGFLNNTAMVAIFIPLTVGLCRRLNLSPSKALIPLSYASIFGGTLTLIGTSTNLLVSAMAEEAGEPPLGMFEFTRLGIIFWAVGMVYILAFAPRLLPSRSVISSLTRKYHMGPYLTELRVLENSKLAGHSCREVGVNRLYDITVLAILRGNRRYTENIRNLALQAGDILIARGTFENILRLRSEQGVALLPDIKLNDQELTQGGQLVAEALITQTSTFIGKTPRAMDFRRHYGAFILAIRRHGETLRAKIADIRIKFGDTLLIMAPRERIDELRQSEEVVIISEEQFELRRGRFWWMVALLLPLIVTLAALGVVDITKGAILATTLLLVVGVLTPRETYRSLDWSVLVLIAAFVPMGRAMVSTGTAEFLASGLLSLGQLFAAELIPYVTVSLLYLLTSLMTQMVSNNAAAIMLVPVCFSLSASLGADPRPFLMAVCFAASAEFMTPMGYQTNIMVYGPGSYRFLDYTRFGAPLNLVFWLLASYLIPRFWPF